MVYCAQDHWSETELPADDMGMSQDASEGGIPTGPLSRPARAVVGRVRQAIHGMGLLPRLLIAEAVVFGALFAGGILFINEMTDSLRDSIKGDRLLLGKVIAEDLDATIEHGITELRQLAEGYQQAMAEDLPADVPRDLDLLLGESTMFTRGIVIVGPKGDILGAAERPGIPLRIDLHRYWPGLWHEPLGPSGVVATGFNTTEYPDPVVAVAVPAGRDGEGEFVVGLIGTESSYAAEVVKRAARIGESGHADVVDERGIALFSTEASDLLVMSDHPESYRSMLGGSSPVVVELPDVSVGDSRGSPHLMSFVSLRSLPWAMAVGTTASEAYAPIRELRYGGIGLLILLIGLAFTATVVVSRRLVQPVRALRTAARAVAEGDPTATISIPWGGEIGELATSLETMRLRLQTWASELQLRVQERTSELEERNRELNSLYQSIQSAEEQLRYTLEKVLNAQEDERKRVSRDLHDGISQALSALSIGLEALENSRPRHDADFREQIEILKELASTSLTDLRRLTIALRPAALDDLGLVPAIRRYAQFYLESADVAFQVLEEGPNTRLDPTLETVIYRVVQEAINNVVRHSGARHAWIHLRTDDNLVDVTVTDDGCGFDPANITSERGVGLEGMEERATIANGKLTVTSRPGHGTSVRLQVPLRCSSRVGAVG